MQYCFNESFWALHNIALSTCALDDNSLAFAGKIFLSVRLALARSKFDSLLVSEVSPRLHGY